MPHLDIHTAYKGKFGIPSPLLARSGFIENLRHIFMLGHTEDLGTTERTVWDGSGEFNYIPTPSILKISSSSEEDSPSGTGVHSVFTRGLNQDRDEVDEIIETNGHTEVETVNTYHRSFGLLALTGGSEKKNVGTMYVSTGGVQSGAPIDENQIWAKMNIGENRTYSGVYSIPRGWKGYLSGSWFNTQTSGLQHVKAKLSFRFKDGLFFPLDRGFVSREGGALLFSHIDSALPLFPESDLELRGEASANSPELTASMSFYLVKDPNIKTTLE